MSSLVTPFCETSGCHEKHFGRRKVPLGFKKKTENKKGDMRIDSSLLTQFRQLIWPRKFDNGGFYCPRASCPSVHPHTYSETQERADDCNVHHFYTIPSHPICLAVNLSSPLSLSP